MKLRTVPPQAAHSPSAPPLRGRRWLSILCAAALLLTLATGCAGEEEDGGDGGGLSLTVRALSPQSSLDPADAPGDGGDGLYLHLYENLLKWTDDGSGHAVLTEGMAQSYNLQEQPNGSVVYTFTLRSGARWSDGESVTAQDFVYAWQRLFSLETPPAALARANMVEGYPQAVQAKDGSLLTGVAAQGDSTLVITLTSPCAYFLDLFCAGALTMPVRQDLEGQYDGPVGQLVTNGPYTLRSLDGASAVLERSETYYDQVTPGPDTITFLWSEGSTEDYESLASGEADFAADLPGEAVAALNEAGALAVEPVPSTYTLLLNTAAEPFSDALVREAFALAVDQEALAAAVANPTVSAATGFVPHGITNRDDQWDAAPEEEPDQSEAGAAEDAGMEEAGSYWDYRSVGDALAAADGATPTAEERAAQAASLLSQAGYPGGSGLPEMEYLYEDTPENRAAAAYLQGVWQEVLGVTVTPRPCTEAELREQLLAGTYTMGAFRFDAAYDDATAFLRRWRSTVSAAAGNLVQYEDQAYDLLLHVVDITASLSAREACLHDAEELLLDAHCVVPLFYYGTVSQLADSLTGLYRDAMGNYFFGSVAAG